MARKRHYGAGKAPFRRHAGPTRGRHVPSVGTLRVARPGSAEVVTEEGTFRIAPGGLREGMNGDVVTVSLVRQGAGDPKAVVQSVLTRACTTFVGSYGVAGPLGVVVPLDERLRRDFFVLPSDESPRRLKVAEGDVVVARILTYPSRREAGVVSIERRLGTADEGLDMGIERVIATHGLAVGFGEATLAEAVALKAGVEEALAAEPRRRDLRDLSCVTIDPVDARDFDDAVSCERLADGGYRLGVHIADVTHYVAWGSSVDLEARGRTCSAYLVDRVLPMLPERLSNDLCSLRPGVDRLAMSVFAELDASGEVRSAQACASAIRSKARLTYDVADEVLAGRAAAEALPCEDGTRPEDVARLLALLDEAARLREARRRDRGAIDFASSEAKVTLDEQGRPTGVRVRRKTAATSLVEEAMLVANEVVAAMLAPHDELPCAYRVHERPSPDSLAQTLPILRELDALEPGEAELLRAGDPYVVQGVIGRVEGTPYDFLANTVLLRAQKRATYLPRNDGHYALGAKAYCHFTSPIRRYPDVTVHRALKRLLGVAVPCWRPDTDAMAGSNAKGKTCPAAPEGPSPRTATMGGREWREAERLMPQLCRTCSDLEREADAAARESQGVKLAELYAGHVGETFSGIVSGCERFGLFVRLDDTLAEGLVPIRALGDEWFNYDEGTMTLTGEATGRRWRLGQRVAVTVAGCDPLRGKIDFTLRSKG